MITQFRFWSPTKIILFGLVALNLFLPSTKAAEILYNRDIRPILSSACFACHGPDSSARKGDLRLDLRDGAIASSAIVPGKPSESSIIQRILSSDPEEVMPPPDSHKKLSPDQKRLLSDWIQSGANYQPHWSLIPPQMPDLPEVRNKSWVRNDIDRFVLSKLEAIGLEPSPESDIRSLARRVRYDLTGLPPSPEEVDEVAMDPSENRYERYVDRLLNRVEWGEHRGRYWLDYARYADTHGIHFDNFREMWAFRDWVIEAFNQNMPFDQFTTEQLAGDLLPNPTLDQRIATGFHRCNITTNEGGIIDEEYRVLYARDRTETTAQVWMGLTANCAVCHDHKFDPLTMNDFYSLSAFFNNTSQGVRDGNRKDTPPIVAVPLKEDRNRYAEVIARREKVQKALEEIKNETRPVFDRWIDSEEFVQQWYFSNTPFRSAGIQPSVQLPLRENESKTLEIVRWNQLHTIPLPEKTKSRKGHVFEHAWVNSKEWAPSIPDLGNWERDQPLTLTFWVYRPKGNVNGALFSRMDEANQFRGWDVWMEGDRLGMHLVHRWPENAIKWIASKPLPVEKWQFVAIAYDGKSKASGFQLWVDGERVGLEIKNDNLTDSISTSTPFRLGRRSQQSATPGFGIQDLKMYETLLPDEAIQSTRVTSRISFLATRAKDQRTPDEVAELFDWYLRAKSERFQKEAKELANLDIEKQGMESRGTIAHVMQELPEPPKAYVLFRGEYDQRRDEVTPRTPKILPPMADDLPRNRLGLAKWLTSKEHPLTARVAVNRFWQEIFGAGLVTSTGDFGVSGQLPTHPELLDYLAVGFRDDKWNVKNFFRLVVTSATYRQSSQRSQAKHTADPENALLSRGPRFRLDAESVRDSALAWSGLLSRRIGGPSVKPYQPPGVWEAVAMPESNTRNYKQEEGENLYRRSMYTFWKRSAPPASLEILNAPNRETCTVRRERTNTPIQALVTLNDPQFVEAARALAQRVLLELPESDNEVSRLQRLSGILLSRSFVPAELGILNGNLREIRKIYARNEELAKALLRVGNFPVDGKLDPIELATWTMLANQLMNLDEAINK